MTQPVTQLRAKDVAEKAAAQLHVAVAKVRQWREQPPVFVRDVFGVTPDAWQDKALEAFPRENKIAGCACKGPGKTALEAWLGWNFLGTRPHPKVPCTSVTGDNLDINLWSEFAKWQHRSEWLKAAFQWKKTRIELREHPETWFAAALTWPRDADPQAQANTLAGFHADYLFFIIDEVSDIPDGVVVAAEASQATGIETKLFIAGNPTRTEGPLYRAAVKDKHLWYVIHITGDPDDPNRSPRINIAWAREQIETHGRDSYYVRVNVLGLFPLRAADKLLDLADIEAAMARTLQPDAWMHEAKHLGADVGRFGDDSSVLCPRQGRMCFQLKDFRLDTAQFADKAIAALEKWEAHTLNVDGGGVGGGTVDHARNRGYGDRVFEVNFGERARESGRFFNRRAEMYWRAAEWVRRDGGCLPRDPLLAQELAAPIYWYDKAQRICLEPKDDIKKRIGRSPDRADAFVLTFATPVAPPARDSLKVDELGPDGIRSTSRRGATPDWDPFAVEGRA